MGDDYRQENDIQRARLFRVTAALKKADLARPIPNGWTVATKLMHLAFWDQYALALLKRWRSTTPALSTLDVDAVNNAVRVLSLAVPTSAVVKLVRTAAEAVDREVAGLPTDLCAAIEQAGRGRILRRSVHRRAHLDQIEQALE